MTVSLVLPMLIIAGVFHIIMVGMDLLYLQGGNYVIVFPTVTQAKGLEVLAAVQLQSIASPQITVLLDLKIFNKL